MSQNNNHSFAGSSSDDSDSWDEVMYDASRTEAIEKSMTNLNIGTAKMAEQVDQLTRSYKEFCANFVMQQKLLREEIRLLRLETNALRNQINNA